MSTGSGNGSGRGRSGGGAHHGPGRVTWDALVDGSAPWLVGELAATLAAPEYGGWARRVERIGGCANPVHLSGSTRVTGSSGGLVEEFGSRGAPGGVVLVPCGDRRAGVCPACARTYWGDIYHLVRAGLSGGKGVPETVSGHPRLFVTLTAPGFGAVHTTRAAADGRAVPCRPRRTPVCGHGRVTSCLAVHERADPVVGAPLCSDCYDYPGAVVWQASLGVLWRRVTTYVPRRLASLTGRTRKDVHQTVRVSYVKMVEFQRRGLVHVHAVIRADGIPPHGGDEVCPAPDWVTPAVLGEAVRAAAADVRVGVDGGAAGSWVLGWGAKVDVADLTVGSAELGGRSAHDVARSGTSPSTRPRAPRSPGGRRGGAGTAPRARPMPGGWRTPRSGCRRFRSWPG